MSNYFVFLSVVFAYLQQVPKPDETFREQRKATANNPLSSSWEISVETGGRKDQKTKGFGSPNNATLSP